MKCRKTRYGYVEYRELFIDGGDYLVLAHNMDMEIMSSTSSLGYILTWNTNRKDPVKHNVKRKIRDDWKDGPRVRASGSYRYCWEGVEE